ncbi:hypothetical protein pb186bvf_013813 [Paramecium bursaria]
MTKFIIRRCFLFIKSKISYQDQEGIPAEERDRLFYQSFFSSDVEFLQKLTEVGQTIDDLIPFRRDSKMKTMNDIYLKRLFQSKKFSQYYMSFLGIMQNNKKESFKEICIAENDDKIDNMTKQMIKIIHTRDFGVYIKLIFFFTKIRRLNHHEIIKCEERAQELFTKYHQNRKNERKLFVKSLEKTELRKAMKHNNKNKNNKKNQFQQMCYIVELDKFKLTYKLSVGYLIFIFVYTLTILVLSIVANQDLKSLPLIYTDITNNWSIDPIYQISLPNVTGCGSGYEYFSLLQNGQTSYTYWSHQNNDITFQTVQIIIKIEYPIYPLCASNEQICGGIYVQNKYCAPIGQCPINSILLVNQTGLQNVDFNKYSYTINITSNLYLLTSTLAESLPISQIYVFGSQACLDNQYSNYDQIYSQALCTNDNRWNLVDQITQSEYQTANSFTSNINNDWSLYKKLYLDVVKLQIIKLSRMGEQVGIRLAEPKQHINYACCAKCLKFWYCRIFIQLVLLFVDKLQGKLQQKCQNNNDSHKTINLMVSFYSDYIGLWIFNGYKTFSANCIIDKLFRLINIKYFYNYSEFNMGHLGDKHYNIFHIYFLLHCGMHFFFHLFGLIFKIKKNCL